MLVAKYGDPYSEFVLSTNNSCRTRDSNPQPQVTSLTLYPVGHDCPMLQTMCDPGPQNQSVSIHCMGQMYCFFIGIFCQKSLGY